MSIYTLPLGQLETNCYIVYDKKNNAIVIDPGGTDHDDVKHILAFLEKNQLKTLAILCTHLHFDHVFSVASLHEQTQSPVWASNDDLFLIDPELTYTTKLGFPEVTPFHITDLKEGIHTFGPYTCEVLKTPGHTPGCLSLYFKEINTLFTGDLLFYHSVGRTDLPRSNQQELHKSIQKKIFVLPSETVVYPGHGRTTSVGEEQTNNPYI